MFFFAKGILGFDWLQPHVHGPLCQELERYETTPRLAVLLPRGWLKTTLCSVAYPLWRAIRDPNIRVCLTQNTHTNACDKLRLIRSIIETNQLFRALWEHLLPDAGCIWKNDQLQLKRSKSWPEATFTAAGTRTQMTSRHFNLIIEDDTVAPNLEDLTADNLLLPTSDDVEKAIGWHRLVVPLLVDPQHDQNLVVGTRWFERDLLSWIREHEDWFHWIERAIRETDGVPDPTGTITWPERFGEEVLRQLEASLGRYMFSCLYLNAPMSAGNMIFQPEWFKLYDTAPPGLVTYTTIDPSGDPEKSKGKPDYNVVMTCGKDVHTGLIYVLDYFRKQCNPGEVIDALFQHVRLYHPVRVEIENVGYQSTLAYWVRERQLRERVFFTVEPSPPVRGSKSNRAKWALQPLFSNRQILMRPHHRELQTELLAMSERGSLGQHDDTVDALSAQAHMWAQTQVIHKPEPTMDDDPLSLAAALSYFRDRARARAPRLGSPLDVLQSPAGGLSVWRN